VHRQGSASSGADQDPVIGSVGGVFQGSADVLVFKIRVVFSISSRVAPEASISRISLIRILSSQMQGRPLQTAGSTVIRFDKGGRALAMGFFCDFGKVSSVFVGM